MKPGKDAYVRSDAEKLRRVEALRQRFAAATPPTRGPLRASRFNGWRSVAAIALLLILALAYVF